MSRSRRSNRSDYNTAGDYTNDTSERYADKFDVEQDARKNKFPPSQYVDIELIDQLHRLFEVPNYEKGEIILHIQEIIKQKPVNKETIKRILKSFETILKDSRNTNAVMMRSFKEFYSEILSRDRPLWINRVAMTWYIYAIEYLPEMAKKDVIQEFNKAMSVMNSKLRKEFFIKFQSILTSCDFNSGILILKGTKELAYQDFELFETVYENVYYITNQWICTLSNPNLQEIDQCLFGLFSYNFINHYNFFWNYLYELLSFNDLNLVSLRLFFTLLFNMKEFNPVDWSNEMFQTMGILTRGNNAYTESSDCLYDILYLFAMNYKIEFRGFISWTFDSFMASMAYTDKWFNTTINRFFVNGPLNDNFLALKSLFNRKNVFFMKFIPAMIENQQFVKHRLIPLFEFYLLSNSIVIKTFSINLKREIILHVMSLTSDTLLEWFKLFDIDQQIDDAGSSIEDLSLPVSQVHNCVMFYAMVLKDASPELAVTLLINLVESQKTQVPKDLLVQIAKPNDFFRKSNPKIFSYLEKSLRDTFIELFYQDYPLNDLLGYLKMKFEVHDCINLEVIDHILRMESSNLDYVVELLAKCFHFDNAQMQRKAKEILFKSIDKIDYIPFSGYDRLKIKLKMNPKILMTQHVQSSLLESLISNAHIDWSKFAALLTSKDSFLAEKEIALLKRSKNLKIYFTALEFTKLLVVNLLNSKIGGPPQTLEWIFVYLEKTIQAVKTKEASESDQGEGVVQFILYVCQSFENILLHYQRGSFHFSFMPSNLSGFYQQHEKVLEEWFRRLRKLMIAGYSIVDPTGMVRYLIEDKETNYVNLCQILIDMKQTEYLEWILTKSPNNDLKLLKLFSLGQYESFVSLAMNSSDDFVKSKVKEAFYYLQDWKSLEDLSTKNAKEELPDISKLKIAKPNFYEGLLEFPLNFHRAVNIATFDFLKCAKAITRLSDVTEATPTNERIRVSRETLNFQYMEQCIAHIPLLTLNDKVEAIKSKMSQEGNLKNLTDLFVSCDDVELKSHIGEMIFEIDKFKFQELMKESTQTSSDLWYTYALCTGKVKDYDQVVTTSTKMGKKVYISMLHVIDKLHKGDATEDVNFESTYWKSFNVQLSALIKKNRNVEEYFLNYSNPKELFLCLQESELTQFYNTPEMCNELKRYISWKNTLNNKIGIIWDEVWYFKLGHLLGISNDFVFEFLNKLADDFLRNPETPFEVNFKSKFGKDIETIIRKKDYKLMKQLYKKLHVYLSRPRTFSIHQICKGFDMGQGIEIYNMKCKLISIDDSIMCLPTKTKPKKVSFLTETGEAVSFLLKGNEDIQIDAKIVEFFKLVKNLYLKHKSWILPLYNVIPLCGLIEWVKDAVPCFALYRNYLTASGVKEKPMELYQKAFLENEKSNEATYQKMIENTPNDLISKEILITSADSIFWLHNQSSFSQSFAVTSILGYVMGDRHLDNLLINFTSGTIIHIDFNINFERGTKLRIPEKVPIRLTRNFIQATVPTLFYRHSVSILNEMRNDVELFSLYFELWKIQSDIDWNMNPRFSEKKRIPLLKANPTIEGLWKPFLTQRDFLSLGLTEEGIVNHKPDEDNNKEENNHSDTQISQERNEVAADMHSDPSSLIARTIDKIKGTDYPTCEDQIKQLIQTATRPDFLSGMYQGWMSWV